MEKMEFTPKEPQTTAEAVAGFLEGDTRSAVSFLRVHRDEVREFCLQVRDTYQKNDTATPFLELARLIESLL